MTDERRRSIRIRRSGLLRDRLGDIDRLAIKFAESEDEHRQVFSMLHDEYLRKGYLAKESSHGLLYDLYSLLPNTVIFVAKSYLNVVSSLSEISDTEAFGLPMDDLYRRELDALRQQGRKIVEMSALVTPQKLQWRNLFLYLARVAYWYSIYLGVNDMCIAVNPKHVNFYKSIFLFEDFGPVRHYPKVNAPAVALRINMDTIREKIIAAYDQLDFECDLYGYFYTMSGSVDEFYEHPWDGRLNGSEGDPFIRKAELVRSFIRQKESVCHDLTAIQKDYLLEHYQELAADL